MTELERITRCAKAYEEKLIELMEPEAFTKYAKEVAKKLFMEEAEGMAESDFKDFVRENFDEITKYEEPDDV